MQLNETTFWNECIDNKSIKKTEITYSSTQIQGNLKTKYKQTQKCIHEHNDLKQGISFDDSDHAKCVLVISFTNSCNRVEKNINTTKLDAADYLVFLFVCVKISHFSTVF